MRIQNPLLKLSLAVNSVLVFASVLGIMKYQDDQKELGKMKDSLSGSDVNALAIEKQQALEKNREGVFQRSLGAEKIQQTDTTKKSTVVTPVVTTTTVTKPTPTPNKKTKTS